MRRDAFFFFFSSRRRHTRWTGDWSSDVCSSDLPDVEQKNAAAAKDAIRFAHGRGFVWDEHHTELANGSVERTIGKRKSGCVCLLPENVLAISKFRLREFEHVRVQISRDNFGCRRQRIAQSTRHDSCAAGNFKNAFVFLACEPQYQIFGPRFKYYGAEIAIVIFRDRSL